MGGRPPCEMGSYCGVESSGFQWPAWAGWGAVESAGGGGCHFAPSGHLAMSEDTSIFNWEGVGEEKSGQDMGI